MTLTILMILILEVQHLKAAASLGLQQTYSFVLFLICTLHMYLCMFIFKKIVETISV